MARKIDKMHELFGIRWEKKCKDCMHLKGGVNEYRKCEVYGESASEATDWALKYTACALWNEPYNGGIPIVNLNKGRRKHQEEPIEGQISLPGCGDYEDLGIKNQFDNMTGSMNL